MLSIYTLLTSAEFKVLYKHFIIAIMSIYCLQCAHVTNVPYNAYYLLQDPEFSTFFFYLSGLLPPLIYN